MIDIEWLKNRQQTGAGYDLCKSGAISGASENYGLALN